MVWARRLRVLIPRLPPVARLPLLRLLVANAGKVLTHNYILREVWGPNTDVQYLRIYIRALRQSCGAGRLTHVRGTT